MPRLDGIRVVLAVLEVHDVVIDSLGRALPAAGAEVVILNSRSTPEAVIRAAVHEDANAVVLATYNGNALDIGRLLACAIKAYDFDGQVVVGGVLNQDTGSALPIDARPGLRELGLICIDHTEDLGIALLRTRRVI